MNADSLSFEVEPGADHPPLDADLERFSAALDAYPAAFIGNPLQLLFLDDAEPIASAERYLKALDRPSLMDERREYLADGHRPWPFPSLEVPSRPDPWELSVRLFQYWDRAVKILPIQGSIAQTVAGRAQHPRADVVLMVIADGLSYYDLPPEVESEPRLVVGVSTTPFGYREVVGQPSLSRRLFSLGYKEQLGYTYYPPEEGTLSGDIFAQLSPTQIMRVREFDEVLHDVAQRPCLNAYLQVTVAGLDQICHAHHDRPPRDYYLQNLLQRFDRLVDCLVTKKRRVLACLTSDHGILWREELEGRVQLCGDLFTEDIRSPRYLKGHLLRPYGKPVTCQGQRFTLLGFPFMTRPLRANEWGVHGGISAWESLVPLRIVSAG